MRNNGSNGFNMKYYAHSLEGRSVEEWQPLEDHLGNVSSMAARLVSVFGGEERNSIEDKPGNLEALQLYRL